MVRSSAILGAIALLGGCQGSTTSVQVVVDSDLSVPAELDRIDLSIEGGGFTAQTATASLGAPGDPDLPRTLAIQYSGAGPVGPYTARATGFSGGTQVVSAETAFTFVEGEERIVEIFLSSVCAGVTCGPGETCRDGRCVPVMQPDGGIDGGSDGGIDGGSDGGSDGGGIGRLAAPCDRVCNMCGALCTDFRIDELNCGACGAGCTPTETCTAGTCTRCSRTVCGGECVSTDEAYDHCGGCGAACAADQVCVGAGCSTAEVGARCAVPLAIDVGTHTVTTGAGADIEWRAELADGGYDPRCRTSGGLGTAVALRFVAPSTGTLRMTLDTALSAAVSFEVFADADERCECALPDACSWTTATRMATTTQAVVSGVAYRIVVGMQPVRDGTLTLTMM